MSQISLPITVVLVVAAGAIGAAATIYVPRFVSPGPREPRMVDWFLAHPEAMQARVAECKNNPGDAMRDADCQNATDASVNASLRKFLDAADKL